MTLRVTPANTYLPGMLGYVVEQWGGRGWILPVWSDTRTPELAGPFREKMEAEAAIAAHGVIPQREYTEEEKAQARRDIAARHRARLQRGK